ncbi:hypothetical protein DFJ43DRAFT_1078400 [Lentinula guzmanii]|uniref:Polysaccharide lyase 14 domain-containing protein n=1 Tax=Lentinula guzmanii TaxID=2804957 RepID=A0AA38JGJ9_9AGAR|nr:hypothetical protein DFJ43DRAFT_1078400 [Lentinula guzmanii]
MVLMTSQLWPTLGVAIISYSIILTAPVSSAYPVSASSAENVFAQETATVYVTEIVQNTLYASSPSSSSLSPAPTFGTIDWEIFALPFEETSTITDLLTVTVPTLSISTPTSTVEVVVTKTVPSSSALLETSTIVETITVSVVPSPSKPTTWVAPAQMTDLSAFNITNFAGGSQNLRIVDDLSTNSSIEQKPTDSNSSDTTEAVAFEVSDDHNSNNDSLTVWTNATSALQILSENSIDPARKPQGGAEFYAVPLDLSDSKNVTLEYSVFFPQEFDWVLGGKLPGLYGGHQGCSGGDAATDCFSTRLMWRKGGQGELYLYAPKDKQTDSLCNDPQSVCDAAYGLSVGRGSFVFAPGNWTKVRQTVILNTPGRQDGCFTLDVNGERVIDRTDVYYRGIPLPPSEPPSSTQINLGDNDSKKKETKTASSHPYITSTTSPVNAHHTHPPSSASDGGFLDPGGLLGGILRRNWPVDQEVVISKNTDDKQQSLGVVTSDTDTNTDNNDDSDSSLGNALQGHPANSSSSPTPGFIGLFFSTFFGGHEKQYASPKDQLVWFKDFAMSKNG